MSKIENVKELYKQIESKGKFIVSASGEFGITPQSMKQNWLCDSGFWSIPQKHQDKLIELLVKQIQIQNGVEV